MLLLGMLLGDFGGTPLPDMMLLLAVAAGGVSLLISSQSLLQGGWLAPRRRKVFLGCPAGIDVDA